MNEHDLLSELRRLGFDASSAGAVSDDGKRLFDINGHLLTYEAQPLTDGGTLENVVMRLYDKMHDRE